jgi:hypothetical protein
MTRSATSFGKLTIRKRNSCAIADNLTARSQTFQYDALQRLTQASGIYGTLAYAWRRVSAAAAGAERTFARRGHAAKTEAPRRARGAACLSAG